MAADTWTAQCAHRNPNLPTQEPGPGRNRRELRRLAAHDQPRYLGNYPLLIQALLDYVPTADELDARTCYVVDGTLLPCWSWRAHPELYSGKHKTTGMNVQVACTITGCLAWISDPTPGRRHDNHCLGESGVLLSVDPRNWVGDKRYVGNSMITPFKKPEGGELLDWQKEFNKQVNKIRYIIEQVIANFKTWRIMHTDYRRPLAAFPETISAVVALHFYTTA